MIFTHRSVLTNGRISQTRRVLSIALLRTYEPKNIQSLYHQAWDNFRNSVYIRHKLLEYHIHYIPSGDSDRPVIVSLWPVSSWTGLWFGPIVFFDPSLFVFLRSHTLTTLSIPPLIIWSLLSPNVTEVTWYVEVRLNTAPLNKMWIQLIFLWRFTFLSINSYFCFCRIFDFLWIITLNPGWHLIWTQDYILISYFLFIIYSFHSLSHTCFFISSAYNFQSTQTFHDNYFFPHAFWMSLLFWHLIQLSYEVAYFPD